MTKKEMTSELARGGYSPFLQTVVGSIVNAQAWVCKAGHRPLVFFLYRTDTEEVVDLDNLPQEEENPSDVFAFLEDFENSVFLPGQTA
ncbi:MAG: hypothetical protein HY914_19220 [Desulfomonile tiedjei]|nr:hypothetical protein [Desulfomonile tiedjei]